MAIVLAVVASYDGVLRGIDGGSSEGLSRLLQSLLFDLGSPSGHYPHSGQFSSLVFNSCLSIFSFSQLLVLCIFC